MDADNFRKLTAILDVLDRYKKSLTAASFQGASGDRSRSRRISRSPSVRSARSGSWMPARSVFVGGGSTLKYHARSKQIEDWPETTVAAIQRKMTIRRTKTLHARRQAAARLSCPELPHLQKLQVDLRELDSPLQAKVESRGLERWFSGPRAAQDDSETLEAFEGEGIRKWASLSDGDVSLEVDLSDDDESVRPDVIFSDSVGSVDLKSLAELEFDEVDLDHITPKVLGQLFDRVLECLQLDFRDLIDKLKTQNGHLKQDIISMKKKLQDAVHTNDEQIIKRSHLAQAAVDSGTMGCSFLSWIFSSLYGSGRVSRYRYANGDLRIRMTPAAFGDPGDGRAFGKAFFIGHGLPAGACRGSFHAPSELILFLVQVQELKDMTERVADLRAETRELTRQLRLMESQLKKYAEQDREIQALVREKLAWEAERQQLSAQIQKLTQELGTRDDGTRLLQLLGDFDRVEALNQEKEEQLKTLAKHLEAKDREIESLNLNLSMKQTAAAAPRRDPRSSILSPRVSLEFYSGTLPRRTTMARRHLVESRSSVPLVGASLAGELRQAAQETEEKPAVTVEEYAQRLELARRKLDQAMAELETASHVNETLREKVTRLQGELDETTKTVEDLTKEVKEKEELLNSAEEKLREQTSLLHATDLKLFNAEEGSRNKEAQLDRLRADLAAVRGELDAALKQSQGDTALLEQVGRQVEQIKRLEKEVAELREQLSDSTAKNETSSADAERLKKLLAEETGKAGEGDLAWRARLADVEAELEAESRRALRAEELEQQVKDLEEELTVLRRTGAEMEEKLKHEIEILRAHMDEQKATFARAEKELQDQRNAAENEKADLARRLACINEELQRLQRAEQLALALEAEPATFADSPSQEESQKVRDLLEKHSLDLERLRQSITELSETKQSLESEQSVLDKKLSTFKQDLGEVQALYQDMHSKLDAALRGKEDELAILIAACNQMEKNVAAKLEQMRKELREESEKELERGRLIWLSNRLQESVHQLKRDNAALQAQLEAAEQGGICPEDRKRLEALEEENRALTSQLADQQSAALRGAALEEEAAALQSLKEEHGPLLHQVETLRGRNADLEALVVAAKGDGTAEIERLQQSCRQLAAQLKQLEEADSKARQAHAENQALLERCAHLETQLNRTSDRLGASEAATEVWQGKYQRSAAENEKLQRKLALLTEQHGLLMSRAAEHQKLSSLMEHVSKELLQIRGDMAKIKDLGTKIQDTPATTVFNVGYPENVIPMVSVHGDHKKEQTVNISGVYDLRMAAGQYATFSTTAGSRAATPLRRNCASSLLSSLRDGISSGNCCSSDVESRMASAIGNGITYVFPSSRRAPASCTTPVSSSLFDKKVSNPSTVLRVRTGIETPSAEQFFPMSPESDPRPDFHPLLPSVPWYPPP
ncbi:putative myosin heavy chain [Neospora caninum Liverpool]|uniref:Putative myosin heavy chain n=1 Tax=Neospora caninum (strain Liverpool) TaxID=572307 RepID=F0VMT2_NEOCL|nr:putative myosin heavy chain [Neospora caninum Liverpool]CBZ55028.1 putative myosin heavy chain [Neospora caninum Liverpool]|eukprot:XP_003885056.1 putative myosin heavy chain [Neospora caninum Liverpool]